MFFKIFIFINCLVIALCAQEANMVTRYYNGQVLRDHQLQKIDLWVNQGKIIAPQKNADYEIDTMGAIIAPGYIDLQINGGFGYDFTVEPEKVDAVALQLPKYGVTAFLPTVVSSSSDQYKTILPFLQPKIMTGSASILGVHLEGPFFCKKLNGAHNIEFLQTFSHIDIEEFYGNLEGVRLLTLAPELPQALETITKLKDLGIIVSAGHTSASYEEMQKGIAAGVSFATHLFNTMLSFHHREPGILGAVLTNKDFYYSIIADGVHLHPAALKLAWQANSKGLVLITDAMEAMGLGDGNYHLANKEVIVKEGKALIAGTNTLAGSIISMDAAVRYFLAATGCSLIEAIEAASLRPACVLGMKGLKGTLDIGADADFIFLDEQLFVKSCFIAGIEIDSSKSEEYNTKREKSFGPPIGK